MRLLNFKVISHAILLFHNRNIVILQVGDEIHVAFGSQLPLILRPCKHQRADIDATALPKNGRRLATGDNMSKNENSASAIAQPGLNMEPLVDKEPRRYFLVGSCYMNGSMDGEVLNENFETEEIILC
jgi:hypothetical protein